MTAPVVTGLVEALRPFARYYEQNDLSERSPDDALDVPVRDICAAAAALARYEASLSSSSLREDTHRATGPTVLADTIRQHLLGIRPDDQAVVLEDDDWRLILASLERPSGAPDRPRR